MKKYIVTSAVGKDGPGFVHRISHQIKELNGNIELQRSTRMADEYAIIILFSMEGPDADIAKAISDLTSLKQEDFMITAREALAGPAQELRNGPMAELIASGADQPAIIDAVTLLLFQHNINIQSIDYDVHSAPMTGQSLFQMRGIMFIPETVDPEQLRDELKDLETEYNFDILFRYPTN